MHQAHSYKGQFTPWVPNHCVDEDGCIPADDMAMGTYYISMKGDSEKAEHFQTVMETGLRTNSYIRVCIQNAQRAYLRDNDHEDD